MVSTLSASTELSSKYCIWMRIVTNHIIALSLVFMPETHLYTCIPTGCITCHGFQKHPCIISKSETDMIENSVLNWRAEKGVRVVGEGETAVI